MQHHSEESKHHVIRHFLKAVVTGRDLEIQLLKPIVAKWKVNLLENKGLIMILSLDEELILNHDIDLQDISIYRYILNMITKEIVEDENIGKTSTDEYDHTIVLLTGKDTHQLEQTIVNIHQRVSDALIKYTNLSHTSSIGSFVSDILELRSSYDIAKATLLHRLNYSGGKMYHSQQINNTNDQAFFDLLEQYMQDIISGVHDNNERIYSTSCKNVVNLINIRDTLSLYRYGIYLINKLTEMNSKNIEVKDRALEILKNANMENEPNKDHVFSIMLDIISLFLPNEHKENSQNNIIEQAKHYIYSHYSEPLSLMLIAEKIGITPSYLSNCFHKNVGKSYIKFLTEVRMEQAGKLLRTHPNAKIYDITEKVGYISVKHFSHIFKQYYGIPPGEYKEQHTHSILKGPK